MISSDNAWLILVIPAVVCTIGPLIAIVVYRKQMKS